MGCDAMQNGLQAPFPSSAALGHHCVCELPPLQVGGGDLWQEAAPTRMGRGTENATLMVQVTMPKIPVKEERL